MIDKRDGIDAATALRLNPHVIEKEYSLGWLLWGISNHEVLLESWLFQGGTCLKNCFFETDRFSEDLDCTPTDAAQIDVECLTRVCGDIGACVDEETGIEFPVDFQKFEIYKNPRGHECVQCRIGYQGPVSPRSKNRPRVKLD